MRGTENLGRLGEVAGEPIEQTGPGGTRDFVYVDIGSIDREHKTITAGQSVAVSDAPSRARQRLKAGDVLVSMTRPNLNAVALVPAKLDGAIGSTGFHVLRSKYMVPQYLYFLVQSQEFIDAMCAGVQGALYPAVRPSDIGAFSMRVPPHAEQTRIVDKLEELLSDLDAGVAELKAAQKKLAQYRQSLLKAAVEGKLTKAWRAQHGEPEESGTQLLARILRERRARWEAKQLAKFEARGKAPAKGWKNKYPEPEAADSSSLPSLPRGWVWATVDQLTTECSYGTSVKCSYKSNGVPVLRIPNVARRELNLDDLKFANEPLHLAAQDYVAQGDILVVRTNGSIGLVGRAAAIDAPLNGDFYFASYLLRLRPVERTVVPRWLSAFLGSSAGRVWIEKRAASSAGQHNISLSTLLTLPIPLPPIAEQHEGMAALGTALEVAGASESDTATSLKQCAAQRKNTLQAAFSGQLVPRDPNDEPAGLLLERIRAERAEREKQPKVRKTKQPKEIAAVVSKLIDVLVEAGDWVPAQEVFQRCGVADGALTDQIETLYADLRALDKAGRLAVEAVTDAQGRKLHDRLKLLER